LTRGISAVEVLVVVVILGVVAALAIPQLGRASGRTDHDELRRSLAILRTAIEMYRQDHGVFPGQVPPEAGGKPLDDATAFVSQLTLRSNKAGHVSAERRAEFTFGPYLRAGLPVQPLSAAPATGRVLVVRGKQPPSYQSDAIGAAWVYNADTGDICANSDGQDPDGIRFDRY